MTWDPWGDMGSMGWRRGLWGDVGSMGWVEPMGWVGLLGAGLALTPPPPAPPWPPPPSPLHWAAVACCHRPHGGAHAGHRYGGSGVGVAVGWDNGVGVGSGVVVTMG